MENLILNRTDVSGLGEDLLRPELDLEDYFPTIHYRRVEGFFASLGFATEVARTLARLTTHRARLAERRHVDGMRARSAGDENADALRPISSREHRIRRHVLLFARTHRLRALQFPCRNAPRG